MRSPLGTLLNRAPVPYVRRNGTLAVPFSDRNDPEAQMRAMGAVGTLFAIVTTLANSTSQIDWHLYRKAASGKKEDRVEVSRHAALDLWARPNPFMPRQEFVETFQQHIDLTGEGWWIIARNPMAKLPLELWPVRPDRMTPVPDPQDFIKGYVYTGPEGQQIPLERDEVIQLRMPNPLDPYRGMGPVQAILTDLDATQYSAAWNRNFFLNSAEPGGIIKVDRRLSDDEFDELRSRWNEQHRGVANAHRVAILEAGEWVDRKFTQRDMQFTQLREVSRNVIREAFGMPKFAVGDVDDVNRATAEASSAWFGEHLTVPRLERIKGVLNAELLPLYGPSAAGLEFDYDTPVPANREADNAELTARAAAAKTLIDAGFDHTEVLEAVGLPEIASSITTADGATPSGIADLVQKVYLGVNTVVTWEEARAILVSAGADLDLDLPPPAAPSPAGAAAGGGGPAGPGESPAPPEPPAPAAPGRRSAPAGHQHHHLRDEAAPDEPREDWQDRLDTLLAAWAAVTEAQRAELVEQITTIVGEGTPVALAGLTVSTETGAQLLEDAMIAQATAGGERMAAVAADQGVTIEAAEIEGGLAADLAAAAAVTAALLGSGLAASAGRETLRVWAPGMAAAEVAGLVDEHLAGLTDATLRTELGGEIWAAENEGRFATLELAIAVGLAARHYEASEHRDLNTCSPCRQMHGTKFDTLAEAQAQYPFGGYRLCEGRSRCRGTVDPRWLG